MKMRAEVDILENFPIDTSLKKKVHSSLMRMLVNVNSACSVLLLELAISKPSPDNYTVNQS